MIIVQLVASVVKQIVRQRDEKPSGILIFLPGVQEIKQCIEAVQREVSSKEADILPLHANLTNDEQSRVFAQTNKWKVIAATNVAEVVFSRLSPLLRLTILRLPSPLMMSSTSLTAAG